MLARSPTQSVMHQGADVWKIVAWAGFLLAGALYMVDPLELLSSSVAPIRCVGAEPDPPPPVVYVEPIPLRRRFFDMISDPVDDVSGPIGSGHNIPER